MLSAADDFETLHEPECNIVAFRYLPTALRDAPPERVDLFQLQLRRAVIESGEYYLVQSRLDGRNVLRTTIINPLTTADDLRGLLECLRRHGAAAAQKIELAGGLLIRRPANLLEIAADFRLVHLLAEMGKFRGRLAALVWLVVLRHDIVVPVGVRHR